MKNFWKILAIVFCSLLLAAHFGRAGLFALQYVCVLIPFLLFWKSKIAARIIQIYLVLGGLEWFRITVHYIKIRMASGEPWLRLLIILGVVAILTMATALVFRSKSMKDRYEL